MMSVIGTRFTSVTTTADGDETTNIAFFRQKCQSLYESSVVASIFDDEGSYNESTKTEDSYGKPESRTEEIDAERKERRVLSDLNAAGDLLAVAVGEDISIFSFDCGTRFVITVHLGKDVDPIAMTFMPIVNLLAIVTGGGELLFVSIGCNSIIHRLKLLENKTIKGASISCDYQSENVQMCIVLESGEIYSFIFPNYSEYFHPEQEKEAEISNRKEGMATMRWRQLDTQYCATDAAIIHQLTAVFLLSTEQERKVALLDLYTETLDPVLDEFDSFVHTGFIRVRYVNYRDQFTSQIVFQFIMALTSNGYLLIWDAATTLQLSSTALLKEGETAKDFMLVDFMPDKEGKISENSKLVLLFMDDRGVCQLQIRKLRTYDAIYTKAVNDATFLLDKVTHEEGMILFVQLTANEHGEPNAVNIHAIWECQPETRLDHLVDRQRWTEAEEFARTFNLDMEKIYIARIEHFVEIGMINLIGLDTSGLDEFLGWMKQVSDENWVAEICIAAVMKCSNRLWVEKILEFIETLKVTDDETKERLALLRYNYQTYREVLGPWRKLCSSESSEVDLWQEFLGGCNWEFVFENFYQNRRFREARLLWCRYRRTLEDWIKEGLNFERLLSEIRLIIYGTDCDIIMEAMRFLEEDVIPVLILSCPESSCTCCSSFLMDVARMMETEHPENFPENSLQIASTMERVIQNMLNSSKTPSRQAAIAYALSVMGCCSEDPADLMGEINVYVRNLRGLEKLKNVYQCVMSYNTYQEQTVESICHMILERVRSVQLIKNNIDQHARPYMNEFKLDPDRTLYNYILKIATSSAGVVSSSNPWDERCLVVAESISNLALRCEALIGVAKRAHPPWTKQLSSAVHAMLKDPTIDLKMASRLREQCDFAALGEMMVHYHIPMHALERYLEQKYIFAKAISFIFRQESVEADPQRRLADALKMIELAKKLRKGLMECHECVFNFCIYLIDTKVEDEWFVNVISCLKALNEADRNNVIDQLIAHVEAVLNCTEGETIRLRTVGAVLCVLERFRKDEVLQAKLNAVRKLQVDYGIVVQLSFLNSDNWKSTILKDFLKARFADRNTLPQITELLKISNALIVAKNVMYEVALDCALEYRSPVAALEYAKFAMQDVKRPSDQLLTLVVRACSYGLWIMSELAENNDFEPIFVMFGSMSDLMGKLVEAACAHLSLSHHVFHIAQFVNLFETVVSQCMSENLVEEDQDEEEKQCLIYGMQRQVGIYQYKMDGSLFNKTDAIQQLATVARTVVVDVLKSTDLIDIKTNNLSCYYKTMREAWKNFYSYLILNNQVLIAICARVSFALLPCYVLANHVGLTHSELNTAVELFLERALAHSYADLEICVALIFPAPAANIQKILVKTRSWAVKRKSPHIMLNLIRLARFCTMMLDDHSTNKRLSHYYAVSWWIKKLGKLGANFPQNIAVDAVVQEFVRCVVSPDVLIEFCKDFSLEVAEALILYATKMAVKVSAEEDQTMAGEMRFIISNALREVDVMENLFMRLYACLMTLCPYSYEIIEVIVSGMEKCVDKDDADQEAILRRASTTIRFLEIHERVSTPTDNEIRWYQERQKFLAKQQGVNHDSTLKVSEGDEMIAPEEEGSGSLYKNSLLTDQLPSRAHLRLPFHPFMFENEKDLQNTLLPMVHAELTLFNVDSWQTFFRAVPEIEISKSHLLSSALLLAVQTCINKGIDMDECDIERIKQLIRGASNRLGTLKGLTDGFRHLPLGETKLRFLSLGIDVLKEWIAKPEEVSVGQADADVGFMRQFLQNMEEAYRSYSIEYVLKKYRLLRAETLDLIFAPQDLIEHIYTNEIDWNNCKDISDKIPCAAELAKILNLNLDATQEKIIQRWLEWDSGTAVVFDPNETSSSDAPVMPILKQENNEEDYRLPYMDPTVSRIVQLSRLRGSKKAAYALKDIYRQNAAQGSHESRIRSACCLLRLLRFEQFSEIMGCDLSDVCSMLEMMLYTRMIDVYKIDLSIETFLSTEKNVLIKSLLNNSRQTSQLALFMASVVIDFQLLEPPIVDMLLTKLCLDRKFEMLVELLKYCALNRALCCIKNIELKWSHASQWLFSSIEQGVADEKQQFIRFLLFCLSCPVEYGRSIGALLHSLQLDKFPYAHRLLMLASSTVGDESGDGPGESLKSAARSNLDFSLMWQ